MLDRAVVDADVHQLRRIAEVLAAVSSPATWRAVRAYRQPYRGAITVLVALGIGVADALKIPVAGVDASGRTVVTRCGGAYEVPAGAEVFLRAMRIERELDGARPDAPLLTRRGGPISDRSLVPAVNDVTMDLGVALVAGQVQRRTPEARQWLRQHGFIVRDVA